MRTFTDNAWQVDFVHKHSRAGRYGTARFSRILALMLAVTLVAAACLCAGCSGSSSKNTDYTGKTPRSDFDQKVTSAKSAANAIRKETPTYVTSSDNEKYGSQLKVANNYYASGKYDDALEEYGVILDKVPYYFPALNNKTLTLLQLKKNDSALKNALVLLELFPDSSEGYLNAQVAVKANGFGESDLALAYPKAAAEAKDDDKFKDAAEYNTIAAGIEYKVKPDDKNAEDVYKDYTARLTTLAKEDPDDKDIPALKDYLGGIATLSGLASGGK